MMPTLEQWKAEAMAARMILHPACYIGVTCTDGYIVIIAATDKSMNAWYALKSANESADTSEHAKQRKARSGTGRRCDHGCGAVCSGRCDRKTGKGKATRKVAGRKGSGEKN